MKDTLIIKTHKQDRHLQKPEICIFPLLKQKKQKYYNLKFNNCKKDIKSTWKLINSIIGKKHKSNCRSLNIDEKIVHDSLKIANYFNKHFADVPIELVKSLPPKKKNISQNI